MTPLATIKFEVRQINTELRVAKGTLITLARQGPPGPPGASGSVAQVVNEVPSGTINGSNATFTTAFGFVPESVEVFVNGLKQRRLTDFNTSGSQTLLFSESPQAGDFLQVNYKRS